MPFPSNIYDCPELLVLETGEFVLRSLLRLAQGDGRLDVAALRQRPQAQRGGGSQQQQRDRGRGRGGGGSGRTARERLAARVAAASAASELQGPKMCEAQGWAVARAVQPQRLQSLYAEALHVTLWALADVVRRLRQVDVREAEAAKGKLVSPPEVEMQPTA